MPALAQAATPAQNTPQSNVLLIKVVNAMDKNDWFVVRKGARASEFHEILNDYCSTKSTLQVAANNLVYHTIPEANSRGFEPWCDDVMLDAADVNETLESGVKFAVENLEDGRFHLPRPIALPSLLDRAGVKGPTMNELSDIDVDLFCHLLNKASNADGIKHTTKDAQVIIAANRISAAMSKDYRFVSSQDVIQEADAILSDWDIVYGYLDHQIVVVKYRNPNTVSIQIPFINETWDLHQEIVIATSDVGHSGMNLYPTVKIVGKAGSLGLIPPSHIAHRGEASLKTFRRQLSRCVHSSIKDCEDIIQNLASIKLRNPANTLLYLLKSMDIPAKYGANTFERKKNLWVNAKPNTITALSVFETLREILSDVMGSDSDRMIQVLKYQEKFVKALSFDYAGHDIAGEYTYKDKILKSEKMDVKIQ